METLQFYGHTTTAAGPFRPNSALAGLHQTVKVKLQNPPHGVKFSARVRALVEYATGEHLLPRLHVTINVIAQDKAGYLTVKSPTQLQLGNWPALGTRAALDAQWRAVCEAAGLNVAETRLAFNMLDAAIVR